ncbi:universal stress protein [Nocardia sp. NPDC003345]
MTGNAPRPSAHGERVILAAVDGSPGSYRAAAWAASEAGLYGCGLHLLNSWVIPAAFGAGAALSESELRRMHDDGEHIVTEAARIARGATGDPDLKVTTETTDVLITPALVGRSDSLRMLVVGSRGLGAFQRSLLGSVSTAVTHHARCPVAVVHADTPLDAAAAGRPVLVGVDGSDNSVPAVELAFDEAARRGVGVVALHAWSDTSGLDIPVRDWDGARASAEALLAESLAGYAQRYPDLEVRRIVTADRPVRSLLDASVDAQLLVVGSHGRGGFAGMLLGSTSNALLHSVDTPMIIVRGPGKK